MESTGDHAPKQARREPQNLYISQTKRVSDLPTQRHFVRSGWNQIDRRDQVGSHRGEFLGNFLLTLKPYACEHLCATVGRFSLGPLAGQGSHTDGDLLGQDDLSSGVHKGSQRVFRRNRRPSRAAPNHFQRRLLASLSCRWRITAEDARVAVEEHILNHGC